MRQLFLSLILFSFFSVSPATADTSESPSYFDSLLNAATQAVTETVTEIALGTAESTRELVAAVNESDDPLEKYNRMMFRFNQVLDEKALQPLATNYREYTPDIVQTESVIFSVTSVMLA
jgi:ABC-type transporter lipoprotein component MlaA